MKINVNATLNRLNGEPFEDDKKQPATLSYVVNQALLANYNEEQLGWKEKLDRYNLASKISKCTDGVCEMTAEQVALVERLVGKLFGPEIVGAVAQILEG